MHPWNSLHMFHAHLKHTCCRAQPVLIERVLAVCHHAAGTAAFRQIDHAGSSSYVWAPSLHEDAPAPTSHYLVLHECLLKIVSNDLKSIWCLEVPAMANRSTHVWPWQSFDIMYLLRNTE